MMTLEEAMKDIDDNEYRTEKIEHESLMWALDCMEEYKNWLYPVDEWLDRGGNTGAKCSFCGCCIRYKNALPSSKSFYQFCPKCGKRMKPLRREY